MELQEVIDEIEKAYSYINDVLTYDSKYTLAKYDKELIVIETDGQSTKSFFYVSRNKERLSVRESADGDAKRFVDYYENNEIMKKEQAKEREQREKAIELFLSEHRKKEQLKGQMQDNLDTWSKQWGKKLKIVGNE
ncbi:hypothetical protein [Burkholderia cenocepacia]|uniref:hypothetical protein n=1 Tax=Burkholderia cenocepacia TaxID=95486 RepID=UPI0009824BB9|nr:hypothetical protein [Burkholderia cenocepacia]AQQ43261.1 hypothetical protein A8E75_30615 [Burkholderia cenocepacia]ONV25287.1 hypothetical protein A8E74_09695 [Burkholderia cenocepacia]ONV30589.1 hypothetical protein A8E78_17430 [Burkholderia cenocepacia]ONV33450.1 hypothetical protein A8E77_15860 [Burkholderia cenocepacia]ONV40558.1 hypothetical protein A8E82_19570 [Burkholderia cenocepacia]